MNGIRVREGDVEIDPDALPRRGLAVQGDDLFEDGRHLGTVMAIVDVRDYTLPRGGPAVTSTRVEYEPRRSR